MTGQYKVRNWPKLPDDATDRICHRVAGLPDGRLGALAVDWPAAMLVTSDELALIVREEIAGITESLRLAEEHTATAERTADTMRDLVDDMTAEVQRLRGRVSRAFWGASVALVLLAGSQLWRACA